MVIEKVSKTAVERQLFAKGDHIVVGISGGPDSVCLLHVLSGLAEKWQLVLHGVHVNHGIRGREADLDQAFTENFCRELGIPCTVFHYHVPSMAKNSGLSLEEMGRVLRYRAFDQVREDILRKHGDNQLTKEADPIPRVRIAVAQNRNDQAETILLRILRGTGPEGLAGMESIRDGVIIRPLLDVSREEIEEYCRENGLRPRTDLTNLMPVYVRNKIRLELLPLLTGYNRSIIDSLCRLGRIASEDKEYFKSQVETALRTLEKPDPHTKDRHIDRAGFRLLHPALSKRLIAKVLKEMGLLQDITAVHLEDGDRLIRQGKTGDQMDFPRGYVLVVEGDTVRFSHRSKEEKITAFNRRESHFSYPVNLDGLTEVPELHAALMIKIIKANSQEAIALHQTGFPHNPYHIYLEYNQDLFQNVRLRTRSPGDHMIPLGMKGTKKIQDFFVDEKIPAGERDRIPLLCFGGEVLWVVGHRINDRYKVKINDCDVVSLEYIRF